MARTPKGPLDRFTAIAEADRLQRLLRERGDYAHLHVRPNGQHLLIQADSGDGKPEVIARATALNQSTFALGFRNHSGRWEPIPCEGPLETLVDDLIATLGPFLDAANFMVRTSRTEY